MKVLQNQHSSARPWTYAQLQKLQLEIAAQVEQGGEGALLLSELAPVITLGRRTAPADLLLPRDHLTAAGIEITETDRGGLATYHGPGQWVLYIVESLEKLTGDRRGIRKAVEMLLSIGQKVAGQYDLSADIRWGAATGVWTSRGKVGSVGVRIQRGVLLHGLSLNGYPTPQSFMGLRPCGLDEPLAWLLKDRSGFDDLGVRLLEAAQNR